MQNAALGLEIEKLFGFKKIATDAVKLEDAVGAAFNKRGFAEGPPPTLKAASLAVGRNEDIVEEFRDREDVVG